jgi:hypothetical protein
MCIRCVRQICKWTYALQVDLGIPQIGFLWNGECKVKTTQNVNLSQPFTNFIPLRFYDGIRDVVHIIRCQCYITGLRPTNTPQPAFLFTTSPVYTLPVIKDLQRNSSVTG